DDLDGDAAAQRHLGGTINDAHAALGDAFEDLVGSFKDLSDERVHDTGVAQQGGAVVFANVAAGIFAATDGAVLETGGGGHALPLGRRLGPRTGGTRAES